MFRIASSYDSGWRPSKAPTRIAKAISKGSSPKTAIVRVTEGADAEATIANMVGSAGSMTGWHAFKGARSELGFKPKI